MKFAVKFVISIFVLLVVAYYGSAFVMPSVTIVNNSTQFIDQIEVALPSSNLNFGGLNVGETNTLHYSLEQNDGEYQYQFTQTQTNDAEPVVYRGSCGYVTGNEIHKRVVITLNANNVVECE